MAGVLGLLFGLFIYSYWLVDLLPAGSRLLTVLAAAGALLGAVSYYLLLDWSAPRFVALPAAGRLALIGASLLCGAALLFGGTTGWLSPARSIRFLLPVHRLDVEASGPSGSSAVALMWFNTSLGDVSYSNLHYTGWKRVGDLLVLENPDANGLVWSGRTGSAVEMVWRGSPSASLQISWDGQAETLKPAASKVTVSHAFAVPWYASRGLVLALGVLVLASLATVLALLLWDRRDLLLPALQEAFTATRERVGRLDAVLIGGIAVLALFLRLPNLGGPYPAVDEYYHLIAARQILEGAALSSVYQRSLWLVTFPVLLSLKLFGYHLWAARLPGLIFNVLAILPLYLLTRRINRPVAVLSVLLYATSPWIVTFARIAREYAYYPFFFFWVILGMVAFIEYIPHGLVMLRDWNKLLTAKVVLLGLALVVPPLFAIFADPLSTFKTIVIAYVVFAGFLLARFDFPDRSNWPFLGAAGIALVIAAFAVYGQEKIRIVSALAFNPVPVSYFVPDPQQQWYYGQLVPLVIVGLIGALLSSYLLRRTNFILLFMFGLYGAGVAFFAVLSKTFFHTRHLLTTQLWFIVLLAAALYLLWKVISASIPWKGRYANAVLAGVLALSVINWQQLVTPVVSTNPDNPISEDYLHDMSEVQAYMLGHVQAQDVLISTVYGLYASWVEQPRFESQYRITTETPHEQILALMAQHQSGWLVIDQIRLAMSGLSPREFAGNPDVEYIGLFGDENVWHWQHSAGSLGASALAGKGE